MSESNCELIELPNHLGLAYPKSDIDSQVSLVKTRSKLLSSCRICLSSIFDPAYLSCGHRFCEKCLNMYWHVREKPDFISCPLCRFNAFNVDFAKKQQIKSTQDFRKMFDGSSEICSRTDIMQRSCTSSFCLKISILMPLIYFLAKVLKYPLINLYSFLSDLALALLYFI